MVTRVQDDINAMVGLNEVKSQLDALLNSAVVEQERKALGKTVKPKNRNMLFSGPPGTGKTTVAEKIAPLFHALGITPTDTFTSITADQLISNYKGESAKRAKKVVNEAKGGVLFVDEAYALVSGEQDEYGKQALAAILPALTWDDTVVIFGGYEQDLNDLIKVNPGTRRRFPTTIEFTPYSVNERAQILGNAMRDSGYRLADKTVPAEMKRAVALTGDGNAGDVETLWGYIRDAQEARLAGEEPGPGRHHDLDLITVDDVATGSGEYWKRSKSANPIGALVPTGRKRKPAA